MRLPRLARNGHKGHKMLLFLFIPIKHPKDNPMLSKKILYSYRQNRVYFLLSLLNSFNKHALNHCYVAY